MSKIYDIAILGSGPGGYVAAIRAAALGLSVCLIEKGALGGVCLNEGCIPTKTLLRSAHLFQEIKHAAALGIKVDNIVFDFDVLMQRKKKVVDQLKKGILYLLKKRGVAIINGFGRITDLNTIDVQSEKIRFEKCIIAVGSEPSDLPGINFDEKAGILSSGHMLQLKNIPKSLLIVGGGVIGCEFADIFNSLGCEVTMIELTDQILPKEDAEIARSLERELQKQGIKIFTKTKAARINKLTVGGFDVVTEDGKKINREKILLCVGRVPNRQDCGLDEAGIKHNNGTIEVSESMQTNIKNFYAVGDVLGKTYLAHAASREGIVAVENITGTPSRINYDHVPRCVYTDPEVASVGISEAAARQRNIKIKVAKFPLAASGRAVVENKAQGMVKLISDSEDNIIGAALCSSIASELIHELCVAMESGIKSAQFSEIVHAHPTLSESIMEAAQVLHSKAIHIL
ncbi:MAG: dihydrolipoyl dehydrogenase [Candidatus Omnitrophica bacterium]|nr:dihydrolipoyl dehydrogenase [Candidatus Omnitrophota bacterium]